MGEPSKRKQRTQLKENQISSLISTNSKVRERSYPKGWILSRTTKSSEINP